MTKERQQTPTPDLKFLTGRRRKWDARLMPEQVWDLLTQEHKKAPWLLYVAVLEDGTILSWDTPRKKAVQEIERVPCVGFVCALPTGKETIQFFTRELKVRPEHTALLDKTVDRLRKEAEDAIRGAALKMRFIGGPKP
jgi:hypothetical protein